jgi:hypothetical protein
MISFFLIFLMHALYDNDTLQYVYHLAECGYY